MRKNSELRKRTAAFAVSEQRRKVKKLAVEYKGGKCEICGYDRCMSVLSFHHEDPSQKDFGISGGSTTRNFEKLKPELDKCVLLCANCHLEKHEEENKVKNEIRREELKRASAENNVAASKNRSERIIAYNVTRSKCPSKEKLEELVSTKTNSQIAKLFDVSISVITNWCKKHGITLELRKKLMKEASVRVK